MTSGGIELTSGGRTSTVFKDEQETEVDVGVGDDGKGKCEDQDQTVKQESSGFKVARSLRESVEIAL